MSTEEAAAASNSLMESQAAAAAAVEPAVQVGDESLSFADFIGGSTDMCSAWHLS